MQTRGCGLYCNARNIVNSQILQTKYFPPAPDLLPLIAAVLRRQYGRCEALCYGVGESESLAERQQEFLERLSQSVLQHCQTGSNVHFHGQSLANVASRIEQQNFKISWSHPTSLLVDATHSMDSTDGEQAAGYSIDTSESFSGLIIEGSICSQDQLAVLSHARNVLDNNGFLFLFGEYLSDDSKIEHSPLANLSSLQQQSERLGYCIVDEKDFSDDAQSCIQLLCDHVRQNSESIAQTLNLSSTELSEQVAELESINNEFQSGRRCFRLFIFQKQLNPAGEYARAEYGDIRSFEPVEIKGLFEASFGVDFDPELWAWKYQLGEGVCVVARAEPGGEIVAHYGGAPRKINYFGDPSWALQSCDVMVLPEMRRQYGRNSLFFKTAATFLEREEGNTANHLLGFGFPNQKAMNIALRLGLYEKTDDFIEVEVPHPEELNTDCMLESVDIGNSAHRQAIDRLWQTMSTHFGNAIIGVRDADYIRYRYFQHPFAARGQYRSFLIRPKDGSEVTALVVTKAHDEGQLLMDLVCDISEFQDALVLANTLICEKADQDNLKFWITRGWQQRLQIPESAVKELGIEIPCNSWNPGPSAEALYGAWWLTAGDMDFI